MIEVVNLTRQKVRQDLIVKIAEKVLSGEKAKKWNISICLVGCAKIKELNKKFRGKDFSTDVLSFSGLENKSGEEKIGEIFVCLKEVQANAKKDGQSLREALNWAVVHSVLHLLGYGHEKTEKDANIMRRKEQVYL
ncbi:MAG: rRNA maturation RNase YbeY [Patescibacteria group bacterium]